jgi:hypothetical protein
MIKDNKIHDYFADDIVNAGIHTSSTSSNWTIQNNRFYQTTSKTWQYNGSENAAIMITPATLTNPGVSQGFTITGNTIGYASANQTGTYTLLGNAFSPKAHFVGIHFKGLASAAALPTVISNNTIAAIGLLDNSSRGIGTNSPLVGILFESGVGTCNDNTIGSQTTNGSFVLDAFNAPNGGSIEVYGILNTSSNAFTSNNNNIGGITANAYVSPVIFAMRSTATGGATWTATGNNIGGTTANSIQTSSVVYGLYNNSGVGVFSSNVVRNLKGSSATGIWLAGTNTVQRNFIHSLNAGDITGIKVSNGSSMCRNNMVALGGNVDAAFIYGFNDLGGDNSFYNNSIYIGGTNYGAADSFALINSGSGTRNYSNNIFVNNRTNAGETGQNYILSIASASGLTADKNVYFGNAAANTFGVFNSAPVIDFAAWQTNIAQDLGSYFADPQYLDPAAATPNLHINPSVPTIVEGKGTASASVTDDYDAQSRDGLSPADIGADAGNFMVVPPTIISLSATSGCTGSSLVITGTYLAEVTQVFIGGTAAMITNTTSTSVTVTVGTGTSGTVSVYNGATATSAATFTVILQIAYYADSDGDGYGDASASVLSCTAVPGYVTNNSDCAPTDATQWRTGNFYVDADNDGYYNGNPNAVAICYGSVMPIGYAASILGTDCDDANSNAHPNHVEIAGNNIDDNCDGAVDETGPAIALIPSQCGSTLANIANTVYAQQTTVAQGYRFEVTNGANIRTYETATNAFSLLNLPGGVTYATTYAIRVAVKVSGFWRAYSSSCNITTPPLAATTNVIASQCGTILANIAATVYCNQVTSANQYRFEVTNSAATRTYDSAANRFSLTNLSGGATYGVTYSVRVALRFGGVWQDYGSVCNVSTPASPGITNLQPSQCGTTISNRWTTLYAIQVPDAQGYSFEVTNGATVRYYNTPVSRFALANLAGGVAAGTVYNVRVAVLYNGVYGNFGPACNVTTEAVISREAAAMLTAFDVKSYPNPFAGYFKLHVSTTSDEPLSMKVYDMIGKLLESKEINPMDLDVQEFGSSYAAGVYNVIVSQGSASETLRVVKR